MHTQHTNVCSMVGKNVEEGYGVIGTRQVRLHRSIKASVICAVIIFRVKSPGTNSQGRGCDDELKVFLVFSFFFLQRPRRIPLRVSLSIINNRM